MTHKNTLSLLQRLVNARGPCGQEDEIASVCKEIFESFCDKTWVDPANNVIGLIKGLEANKKFPVIRIMVHMDEISMIVKRINDDGTLRVDPLGGILPFFLGQGIVEIMGRKQTILGVLSQGSIHITHETQTTNKILPKEFSGMGEAPTWQDSFVVTRKTPEELKDLGIHPGTRVVIAQDRRQIQHISDSFAGYFMDNRAAITVAITAIKKLVEENKRPKGDVYLVATTSEELGAVGSCYAARTLPGDISLAIDVGPVAKEYKTIFSSLPIVVYKDSKAVYDKSISDRLFNIGVNMGMEPQSAVFGRYYSDASIPKMYGQTASAALLCLPTENTHGYEIIHQDAISCCADLVAGYILNPIE